MPSLVEAPTTPLRAGVGPRQLRTVDQFCEEHFAFTRGGMRWLLFHRKHNGLDKAVVRIGRKLLIDLDKFFEWVDAQNGREGERKE